VRRALVVVDPVSTGANLAHEIMSRGIPCVRVFSRAYDDDMLANLVSLHLQRSSADGVQLPEGLLSDYVATVFHSGAADEPDAIEITVSELRKLGVVIEAVIAGSEFGVQLADNLSERLGKFSPNRTSKRTQY